MAGVAVRSVYVLRTKEERPAQILLDQELREIPSHGVIAWVADERMDDPWGQSYSLERRVVIQPSGEANLDRLASFPCAGLWAFGCWAELLDWTSLARSGRMAEAERRHAASRR